jgi:hypothetical protein
LRAMRGHPPLAYDGQPNQPGLHAQLAGLPWRQSPSLIGPARPGGSAIFKGARPGEGTPDSATAVHHEPTATQPGRAAVHHEDTAIREAPCSGERKLNRKIISALRQPLHVVERLPNIRCVLGLGTTVPEPHAAWGDAVS